MTSTKPMFFKNLSIYRIPVGWPSSALQLEEALANSRFHPCGSQQELSRGFAPVWGSGDDLSLVHFFDGQYLLALHEQKRMLPSSVVNEAVAEKAAEIEQQQGFVPGRRQLKEIKEEVRMALLPKAFLKNSVTRIWINPKDGWLVIDSGSPAKADMVLGALYQAIPDFPVSMLRTTLSPVSGMTAWLVDDDVPEMFTVDLDCELRSPLEEKATVRYIRHTLELPEIREHLSQGKRPTRLALTFDSRISFVMTDNLLLKNIKFLDLTAFNEANADEAYEDIFNAEFALMAGEFSTLLSRLVELLGGEAETKE